MENRVTTLEEMITRHNGALSAANICHGSLEGTPEEAELHAAVDAFEDSTAKLTSFEGVMEALRLAVKENEGFSGSIVPETLVKGVLEFMEGRKSELPITQAISPVDRLRNITIEASKILAFNDDLMIDFVTVYKHGIHTALSIPSRALSDGIKAALEDYNAKEAIFRPLVNDLVEDDFFKESWNAKEAAERVLLREPCLTLDDVRAKAKLVLEDENVFDSIINCIHSDGTLVGHTFLRSLLGEPALSVTKEGVAS
jgi:hypothetical protein